jgi:hypothetical protein
MTFVIQMRGREWPESMGWQDTTFLPEGRTPAEFVAFMNDADPQIEYRLVSDVVQCSQFDLRERHTIEVLLLRRIDEVQKSIAVFRDASHLSGMDQALASAIEESVFLHKLLKRVEALTA